MHTSGRSYFEAIRYIKSKETETDIEQIVNKALVAKPEYTQYDQILIKRLNQQALDSPRAMRYYSGRLVSEDSVKKFGLGFSEKQDMVTIPVHSPDGTEVGFVGRSIENKTHISIENNFNREVEKDFLKIIEGVKEDKDDRYPNSR
jgi:hypothetical protein